MGEGGKLFLKFKEKFWEENVGFYLIEGFLNYFRACGSGKSDKNNILSTLVTGNAYESI